MIFQGKNILYGFDTQTEYTFETMAVDDSGNMDVKLIFNRIIATREGEGETEKYDSNKNSAPTPEFALIHVAAAGNELRLRYTPEGKITSIEGHDRIKRNFDRLSMGRPKYEELLKSFNEEYSREGLIYKYEFQFPNLEKIKTDDTWKLVDESKVGVPLRTETNFQIANIVGGIVTVDYTISINSVPDRPYVTNGITFHHDIRGLGHGVTQTEADTGMDVLTERSEHFSGDLSMKSKDSTVGVSVSFPFSFEGSLTFRATRITTGK